MKSLKQFDYGEVSDNDSVDLNERSVRRLINCDIDRTRGALSGRLGIYYWTLIKSFDIYDEAGSHLATPIPEPLHKLKQVLFFDSGITTSLHCCLIITEKLTLSGTGAITSAEYCVYSNAPFGGNDNTTGFQKLEKITNNTGPYECGAFTIDGVVYVYVGNSKYHRVHYCLYEGRTLSTTPNTRGYFGVSNLTVNSSYDLNNATGDGDSLHYGKGGRIFNGWIYDWHTLYCDGTSDYVRVFWNANAAVTGDMTKLTKGKYKFFVCGVIDGNPDQWSVPSRIEGTAGYINEIDVTDETLVPQLEIRVSSKTTFNRRLKRIDLLCQRSDLDGKNVEIDATCILQIDINTGVPSPWSVAWTSTGSVYYLLVNVDGRMYQNSMGYQWLMVSGGRPQNHSLADISIKCNGIIAVKERLLALGCAGDPGQERIFHTSMGFAGRGTRDIWWKDNNFYKEVGQKVNAIVQWRGKIFMFYNTFNYHFDMAQRQIPSPWPVDEKTNEVGYGVGTEIVKSIAVSANGVFIANYDGVFINKGTEDIPILLGRRLSAWLALTDDNKKQSIGVWYGRRKEYWLLVRVANNGTASDWEVWIWNNDNTQENWRTYQFYSAPEYFWIDILNKLCWSANSNKIEFEKKDPNGGISDLGQSYQMRITTQHLNLGDFMQNNVERVGIRRKTYSTTYDQMLAGDLTVDYYRDEMVTAVDLQTRLAHTISGLSTASAKDANNNGDAVRELRFKAKTLQLDIKMTTVATMKEVPEIQQIDLMDSQDQRRSN